MANAASSTTTTAADRLAKHHEHARHAAAAVPEVKDVLALNISQAKERDATDADPVKEAEKATHRGFMREALDMVGQLLPPFPLSFSVWSRANCMSSHLSKPTASCIMLLVTSHSQISVSPSTSSCWQVLVGCHPSPGYTSIPPYLLISSSIPCQALQYEEA